MVLPDVARQPKRTSEARLRQRQGIFVPGNKRLQPSANSPQPNLLHYRDIAGLSLKWTIRSFDTEITKVGIILGIHLFYAIEEFLFVI
jgi:hypothetical protein